MEKTKKTSTKKQIKTIKLDKIHTKKYLDNLKATYEEEVVFILPSGREYK